jgi:hypothetical protein
MYLKNEKCNKNTLNVYIQYINEKCIKNTKNVLKNVHNVFFKNR